MARARIEVAQPRKSEIDQLVNTVADALGVSAAYRNFFVGFCTGLGQRCLRVIRVDGRVAGGGGFLPMGQYWGGKSVPCTGVTVVGVAPEYRGSGAAHRMMSTVLNDDHRRGVALSNLYASTMYLYRKSGYECAADRIIYELDPRDIDVHDRECDLERHTATSTKPFRDLYARVAGKLSGPLDRHPALWSRLIERAGIKSQRYLVRRRGRTVGYVLYTQESWREPKEVTDAWFTTAAAGRRILTLLADLRSVTRRVRWSGGPHDPLLALLADADHAKEVDHARLMLRIVHVGKALAARGYNKEVAGELHFRVEDDVVAGNAGDWVLTVAGGRGRVRRGGEGRIRVDVRRLAQLYAGYLSPTELLRLGGFAGPAADLEAAAAIFAGPAPFTPDMF